MSILSTRSPRGTLRAGATPAPRGFTLVELLVVIAIIGTLVGLLLPAVQSAREAARKSQCSNNSKQLALGALNYESANGRYPTGGKGYDFGSLVSGSGSEVLNVESFFVQVLPFIEQAGLASKWQSRRPYWSTDALNGSNNSLLAATKIGSFLCPSNGLTKDEFGGTSSGASANTGNSQQYQYYGQTDYMPTVFTDLDPVTGRRNTYNNLTKNARRDGLLTAQQTSKTSNVVDGSSNTVLFMEDAGRTTKIVAKRFPKIPDSTWVRTAANGVVLIQSNDPYWVNGTTDFSTGPDSTSQPGLITNRWADPESGSGVSGAGNDEGTSSSVAGYRTYPIINNNKSILPGGKTSGGTISQYGGGVNGQRDAGTATAAGANCSWDRNNCGPNNEPFSMHAGGGCFAGFGDGSVHWLSEKLDVQVIRQLIDPSDGEAPLAYQ